MRLPREQTVSTRVTRQSAGAAATFTASSDGEIGDGELPDRDLVALVTADDGVRVYPVQIHRRTNSTQLMPVCAGAGIGADGATRIREIELAPGCKVILVPRELPPDVQGLWCRSLQFNYYVFSPTAQLQDVVDRLVSLCGAAN